jgi:hypothetical protein
MKNTLKVDNLYNIQSFKRFNDSLVTGATAKWMNQVAFRDAALDGVVLSKNLVAIDPTIYEQKYPENYFVNRSGIAFNNVGGWERSIESLRTRPTGSFRNATDASNDGGIINIAGEGYDIKVIERKAESNWSDSDVRTAALQGVSLVSKFVSGHSEIYQKEIDQAALLGTGTQSGVGLLNYSGFDSASTTDTIASGILTTKQVYDYIAGVITDQWSSVFNTPEYMANKVAMAPAVYNYISKTPLSTTMDNPDSILTGLRKNFMGVDFEPCLRCDSSFFASGGSRTIAYSNNRNAMQFRLPLPLEISNTWQLGFTFHVEGRYRIAGLDVLEDASAYILTGL